jgi:hypothetical protein
MVLSSRTIIDVVSKYAALLCCTALRTNADGLLGDGSCEKKKNDAEDDDTGDKEGLILNASPPTHRKETKTSMARHAKKGKVGAKGAAAAAAANQRRLTLR